MEFIPKKNLANEEMYIQSFHNFPVSQACGKRWNSNLPLIPSLCSLENRNLLWHESLFIFGKRYCPYLYRHLMHLSTNTAFCFFFFSHDYSKNIFLCIGLGSKMLNVNIFLMRVIASFLFLGTPRPRPGAVVRRTNPTSKEPWLRGRRRA